MRNSADSAHFPRLVAALLAAAMASAHLPAARAQESVPADEPGKTPGSEDATEAALEEKRAAARTAYAAGEAAYREGSYEEAARSFEEAHRILPSVHARYWAGMSWAQAGEPGRAYDTLQPVQEDPARDQLGAERLGALEAQLRKLATVPARVRLTTVPAAATVAVDGEAQMGEPPMTLELAPGSHRIVVSAPGYESREIALEVTPGQKLERDVELAAVSPPPTDATAPPAPQPAPIEEAGPERSNVPAYVTLGVAGASAVVGSIFGLKALSSKSAFDDAPNERHANDVERNALIADMAFGVAITLGITGIVLLASGGEEVAPPAEAKKRTKDTRFSFAPFVSPQGGGAAARLSF